MTDKLTANFARSEFYIHEAPPMEFARDKLPKVAALAQWLRELAGSYGRVTSYYRSPARNLSVGGVTDSQHTQGEAVDLIFPLISLRELATRVKRELDAGRAPKFGQVIFYPDTGETHISLPGATKYHEMTLGQKTSTGRKYSVLASLSQLPTIPKGVGILLVALVAGTAAAFFFPPLIA